MVELVIKSKSKEEANKLQVTIYEALVGSPAYINSEIVLVDIEEDNSFVLIVGNSNNRDAAFDAEFTNYRTRTNKKE